MELRFFFQKGKLHKLGLNTNLAKIQRNTRFTWPKSLKASCVSSNTGNLIIFLSAMLLGASDTAEVNNVERAYLIPNFSCLVRL